MSETPEVLLLLGRIQGGLEAIEKRQDEQTQLLHGLDGRLRQVERRAAVQGALGGGAVGLAVSAVVHLIRARLETGV